MHGPSTARQRQLSTGDARRADVGRPFPSGTPFPPSPPHSCPPYPFIALILKDTLNFCGRGDVWGCSVGLRSPVTRAPISVWDLPNELPCGPPNELPHELPDEQSNGAPVPFRGTAVLALFFVASGNLQWLTADVPQYVRVVCPALSGLPRGCWASGEGASLPGPIPITELHLRHSQRQWQWQYQRETDQRAQGHRH